MVMRRSIPIIASTIFILAVTLPSGHCAPTLAKPQMVRGQSNLLGLRDTESIGTIMKEAEVPFESEAHAVKPSVPQALPQADFSDDPLAKLPSIKLQESPTMVSGRAQDFLEAFEAMEDMDSDDSDSLADDKALLEDPLQNRDTDETKTVGELKPAFLESPKNLLETTLNTAKIPSQPISEGIGGHGSAGDETDEVVSDEANRQVQSPAQQVEAAKEQGQQLAATTSTATTSTATASTAHASNSAASTNANANARTAAPAVPANPPLVQNVASAGQNQNVINQENSAVGPTQHINCLSILVTLMAAIAVRAL